MPRPPCDHPHFRAKVVIHPITRVEGGPVIGHAIELKISCEKCDMPFRFIGLPAGSHYAEPRVSIDGTELRAPIEPAEHAVFALTAAYTAPPRAN